MDEFIEYEAMTFALGGNIECPEYCKGILIPTGSEDTLRLVCDVCDQVFVTADDDD